MIGFFKSKGKQNVQGEQEGVHIVSNISQSKHIHIFFFIEIVGFCFIQLYPFFDRKIKNSLNLDVNH